MTTKYHLLIGKPRAARDWLGENAISSKDVRVCWHPEQLLGVDINEVIGIVYLPGAYELTEIQHIDLRLQVIRAGQKASA